MKFDLPRFQPEFDDHHRPSAVRPMLRVVSHLKNRRFAKKNGKWRARQDSEPFAASERAAMLPEDCLAQ
jgi:hypothetical protein